MKEIDGMKIGSLTNGAHIEYMNRVKTLVNADATAKTKGAVYLTPFEKALAQETSDFAVVTKSLKSNELENADKARDKYFNALKQIVESSVSSPLEEVAKAAQNVKLMLDAHEPVSKAQYDEETAKLDSITSDLEGDLKADATTLGITAYVTAIKEQNELVRTAMAERQEEKEGKAVGAMKTDRAATDDLYRSLIKILNAYSFIDYSTTGSSDLESIIVKLNLEIKHYKEQALGVKANSSTDNSSSTDSGSGGTSDSGSGSSDNGGDSSDSGNSGGDSSDSGSDSGDSGNSGGGSNEGIDE